MYAACKHSLRDVHQKYNGVEGSTEDYIITFQSGQAASLQSFQQRCMPLESSGIPKHDAMYIDKTRCLPPSLVIAFRAPQYGPMPHPPPPSSCMALNNPYRPPN